MASLSGRAPRRSTAERDFLGLTPERPAPGSSEEKYALAWSKLDAGDTAEALQLLDSLAITETQNAKVSLTRGIALARVERWENALTNFSRYLQMTDSKAGVVLADAHYARAVCFARLGHKLDALMSLDACLRASSGDETLSDADAGHAPRACVARCLLLQDRGLRQRYDEEVAKRTTKTTSSANSSNSDTSANAAGAPAKFSGDVWYVPVSALETALEQLAQELARRAPLLLDPLPEHPAETYFLYKQATIVDAKKLVVQVRSGALSLAAAREQLRSQLVRALRWGHALVVRMGDTAADFSTSYCDDDTFPLSLFDAAESPAGTELCVGGEGFGRLLRPEDVAQSHGRLSVPSTFRVVVTSTFDADRYSAVLSDALPLSLLQPMLIKANEAPLGEALGAPRSQQLQGDRTSLFLQS